MLKLKDEYNSIFKKEKFSNLKNFSLFAFVDTHGYHVASTREVCIKINDTSYSTIEDISNENKKLSKIKAPSIEIIPLENKNNSYSKIVELKEIDDSFEKYKVYIIHIADTKEKVVMYLDDKFKETGIQSYDTYFNVYDFKTNKIMSYKENRVRFYSMPEPYLFKNYFIIGDEKHV